MLYVYVDAAGVKVLTGAAYINRQEFVSEIDSYLDEYYDESTDTGWGAWFRNSFKDSTSSPDMIKKRLDKK
jgi:hypothetical protein